MEAVAEKKNLIRVPDEGFDHKLTHEELEYILDNYDYNPDYDDEDDSGDYKPEPIYDRYGNPSRWTLDAMYETRHGLTTTVTLEELFDWIDKLL